VFTAVPSFIIFLLPDLCPCSVKNMCKYVHICDYAETIYGVPLLPNNTARGIFLHKQGTMRSVDYVTFIGLFIANIFAEYNQKEDTAVAQWLRCCATNRKVAGSIPAGVTGIFH